MDNEWQKSGMAVLLENQARQLISENSKTSPNAGGGVGDEEWSGVALPLVRRVFGNIVALRTCFSSAYEFAFLVLYSILISSMEQVSVNSRLVIPFMEKLGS